MFGWRYVKQQPKQKCTGPPLPELVGRLGRESAPPQSYAEIRLREIEDAQERPPWDMMED